MKIWPFAYLILVCSGRPCIDTNKCYSRTMYLKCRSLLLIYSTVKSVWYCTDGDDELITLLKVHFGLLNNSDIPYKTGIFIRLFQFLSLFLLHSTCQNLLISSLGWERKKKKMEQPYPGVLTYWMEKFSSPSRNSDSDSSYQSGKSDV